MYKYIPWCRLLYEGYYWVQKKSKNKNAHIYGHKYKYLSTRESVRKVKTSIVCVLALNEEKRNVYKDKSFQHMCNLLVLCTFRYEFKMQPLLCKFYIYKNLNLNKFTLLWSQLMVADVASLETLYIFNGVLQSYHVLKNL